MVYMVGKSSSPLNQNIGKTIFDWNNEAVRVLGFLFTTLKLVVHVRKDWHSNLGITSLAGKSIIINIYPF